MEEIPKENKQTGLVNEELEGNPMETLRIDQKQVITWQEDDEGLQRWLQTAQPRGVEEDQKGKCVLKEGLLYWIEGEKELLVVSKRLKATILKLAHDIPLAGHLAVEKTLSRIKQQFTWSQVRKEVEEYCLTCQECQKTQIKTPPDTPLIPLPLVDRPFDRVGIDTVGPLTKSAAGHTHILVLIDYATRYPEAVPLRSTHAKILAKELMGIFSRVGFLREILTDRGTNFMSNTLKNMWPLLKAHPLKTSV